MQLFYAPHIESETYTLNLDESKHCVRVLRKKKGDFVQLVDGKGGIYTAIISDPNPKQCVLNIESVEKVEDDITHPVHIAIAPTKNNVRFEWFLEKATEIGVSTITPIICDHSERKMLKTDRLKNVLISAMKQSERIYLPKLNPIIKFDDFIKQECKGQGFIAHCQGNQKPHLKNSIDIGGKELSILIGPEGDFSADEILRAEKMGYKSVSLGESRLRTETAAIVACHTCNLINQ